MAKTKTTTKSDRSVRFVNSGSDPYTFRLRAPGQPIPEAKLVTVPRRDPGTGAPGRSEPVPYSLVEANASNEGLASLIDDGLLDVEEVA